MRKKQYYRPYGGRKKPVWLLALLAAVLAALLSFAVLLGVVLTGARDHIVGQPQVMVILGCKVESWGPSILLQDRLDKALDYLEDHPDLTIVVSGGQGDDEHQSEAQCMYDYLTAHGVDGGQILMEDQSHNTWENICFTQELLQAEGVDTSEMLVVSNGFHLARVRMLWDRAWEGEYTLSTLAAPSSHIPSRLKMYIREPLALVKSYLFDR
ncbi:YdcF family protein [uncultured Flavonifractor sp.]|uniref:YdcF family protein n=1 Tax=Candidatus Flavonifractor intestinigallinarum TaxID=2838586 RepID=A0A9D2MLL3_9FIRM|nr:YdcF family protein [uncultured Flavonifractor sp.]HJB80452.1 YdcF family protein [Candidatus Flavonifractor intestinigallinarum]